MENALSIDSYEDVLNIDLDDFDWPFISPPRTPPQEPTEQLGDLITPERISLQGLQEQNTPTSSGINVQTTDENIDNAIEPLPLLENLEFLEIYGAPEEAMTEVSPQSSSSFVCMSPQDENERFELVDHEIVGSSPLLTPLASLSSDEETDCNNNLVVEKSLVDRLSTQRAFPAVENHNRTNNETERSVVGQSPPCTSGVKNIAHQDEVNERIQQPSPPRRPSSLNDKVYDLVTTEGVPFRITFAQMHSIPFDHILKTKCHRYNIFLGNGQTVRLKIRKHKLIWSGYRRK